MGALSHEISSNLVSLQEFLDKGYCVEGSRVSSHEKQGDEFDYVTCMMHTFESVETQKLLIIAEPNLRDRIFKVYRGFRSINDKADALKQVFRPWRVEYYIDAVDKFKNELWIVFVFL